MILTLIILLHRFYVSLAFISHDFARRGLQSQKRQQIKNKHQLLQMKGGDSDILTRAYKGEVVERTPVWLMRQAGRYMADFRKYSEKYPFRQRSETPEIAIELSLQPYRRFGVDGVILFSDILTPLPALGVDFTIIENKGPKILHPIRSMDDINKLGQMHDPAVQLPFIAPILTALRSEVADKTSLIGFIGAPWTLAAYSVEGGHSKLCVHFKRMCYEQPAMAHALLASYTAMLCSYADHQVQFGAQIIQIFESWAHHMSEELFVSHAMPYAEQVAAYLKAKHGKDIPVVYFANGGSAYLTQQLQMKSFDAFSLDWSISMASARRMVGNEVVLAGNLDPLYLHASSAVIEGQVRQLIDAAGGPGNRHVLNLGHGVEKDMSEESVLTFVQAAKEYSLVNSK